MATWQTELQSVKQTVLDKFSNGKRDITDLFTGTVSKKISEVSSFFKNGTTVVGINVNKIPEMKVEIRDYVQQINSALSELKNYDPEVAFKGEKIVTSLKTYIDAVIEACDAIASNMLAFNDQLTKVEEAYKTKDESSASVIDSSSQSTRSAYTKYTEQGV